MQRRSHVETGPTDAHLLLPRQDTLYRHANTAGQQAAAIHVQETNTDIAAMLLHVSGTARSLILASISGKVERIYRSRLNKHVTVNQHRAFRLEGDFVRIAQFRGLERDPSIVLGA